MCAPSTGIASITGLLRYTATGLTVLFLAGCSSKSTPQLQVSLPQLPATVSQPCALPSPLPDGAIPTLITALLDAWEAGAECEVSRAAAVKAYENARNINNGDAK